MRLSNERKYFLLTCFCSLILIACGGSPANNGPISISPADIPGEYPFSIKEPTTYQAEIVATGDGVDKKWQVARDGELWRIDFPEAGEPSRTRMRLDAVYSIDHKRKIYTVAETGGETVAGLTDRFFKGKDHRNIEKLESSNGVTKFRIKNKSDQGEIIMSVDDTSGFIVREEFVPPAGSRSAPFVYEIRNLKQIIDDGVFAIPAGYRKVTPAEYQRTPQKEK
jgi:hypothetical protein